MSASASGQTAFWNWESPHVHPIALTPSGTRLLAVNTADNRVEMFDVSGGAGVPVALTSIAVGLDPVSVRCVSDSEAWVVNRVSDSVSIIDLNTRRVTRTIGVGDEPCDVVFAGGRAFVSVSERNEVRVWDLANLGAAPTVLPIQGEDPRSLAVSPDGTTVYAGIFHSGNKTTAVRAEVVSQLNSPYAGQNPAPNQGNAFNPPVNPALPTPPAVAMIVRQNAAGQWMDDNSRNWSSFVTWGLNDQDVAIINASTLGVSYARGLMTTVMAVGVKPDGTVTAVGTEALNQVRFEPVVNSVFIRAQMASFNPAAPTTVAASDLNPHLNYAVRTLSEAAREDSVGDPRAIEWLSTGKGYVAGMGSNNVVIVDGAGGRVGRVDVGQGPTGIALAPAAGRAFVLNRFDGTISTIDTTSDSEISRVSFFDPTPSAVRLGRPLLYDTHLTSGLGQASCGACHIDGRNDGLAWDLGDPAGTQKVVNQPCRQGPGNCGSWSPMKGPMITQTLLGSTSGVALHWRGDRENVAAFNVAYTGLQGLPAVPSATDMQRFTDFLATIRFAPNPNRNIDGTLVASLPSSGGGTGNAITGQNIFNTFPSVGPPGPGGLTCRACHSNAFGSSLALSDPNLPPEPQTLKVSPLMDLHERAGMSFVSQGNNRGFGFGHDANHDALFNLFGPGFNFPNNATGIQQRKDVEAFMLSFGTDTHPAVGQQETLDGTNNAAPNVSARLTTFQNLANVPSVGLIAKRVIGGVERGWQYLANTGNAQPDAVGAAVSWSALLASATTASPVTVTVVPRGTERRIGIDRDADGAFDNDEIALGYNPADPASVPPPCPADLNDDGATNTLDLTTMLGSFGQTVTPHTSGDINGDGAVNTLDLTIMLARFGGC
ncbi:MAG: dockerin type I domain-containing protein [Phycisphaerales bacterium]